MIHEYKTGRAICGFVEFIAWIFLAIAVIVLLVSLGKIQSSSGVSAIFAVQAISSILGCLLILLIVQMSRAAMDGSVASQTMVMESRRHHTEMISAVRQISAVSQSADGGQSYQSRTRDQSSEAAVSQNSHEVPSAVSTPFQKYNGFKIYVEGSGFRVGNQSMNSRDEAQEHIDEMIAWQRKLVHHGIGETTYRGVRLLYDSETFTLDGRTFSNLANAANYLDEKYEPSCHEEAPEEPLQLHTQVPTHPPARRIAPHISEYRGYEIFHVDNRFAVQGLTVPTLEAAQRHIDNLVEREAASDQGGSSPDRRAPAEASAADRRTPPSKASGDPTDDLTPPTLVADRRPPPGLG